MKHPSTLAIVACLALSTTAKSATWETKFDEDSNGPVCFLFAQPTEPALLSTERRLPTANITIQSFEPLVTEFSTVLYIRKTFEPYGFVEVNGKKFEIATRDGNGWIRDLDFATPLLNELRSATTFSITYTEDGAIKTDRYSVGDFDAKLEELRQKCRIKS